MRIVKLVSFLRGISFYLLLQLGGENTSREGWLHT